MIKLKQVIRDTKTNSVEAAWVDADGVPVKCHSYANVQMGMFRADVAAWGGNIAEHEAMIAAVEAGIVPYVPTVAELQKIEDTRIASLWQAAHDYEYSQVSGSAIGLLAMGVMQSKPKCLAVQGWIKTIWTEYYTRKATGSTDTDFSIAGVCPHSVPELMAELGV